MAAGQRLRHAEPVMGTVFSFDVPATAAPVLPAVLRWLHWVDEVFSTYREDSDVSRFGRGEAGLADCAPELAEVIAQCAVLSELSGGYFTDRPAGRFDPSGFVKGWSVEHAAAMLTAVGHPSVSVNGAGDVQCAGEPEPGRPWRIGIADPLRPGTAGRRGGRARLRRGHLGHRRTGCAHHQPAHRPAAAELASVTVAGPRVTSADAYATAAFAMGPAAREWVETLDGYEALAIAPDGARWQTSGFAAYAVS